MIVSPLSLATALIQCPSVTPDDAGTLDLITSWLQPLGFTCVRLPFGQGADRVDNLFAYRGRGSPHLCFAGHVDVVPTGPLEAWTYPPFSATVDCDTLWGRGASDMKGAIAAFIAAVYALPSHYGVDHGAGCLSLLLTADEEGPGIHGTKPVLAWMAANNLLPDFCIVGEPTCSERLGDTLKIGRRGSLNAVLTVRGVQGHVAYPDLAHNPIQDAVKIMAHLLEKPLDQGHPHFDPSNLEITSIDVGNPTTNIIPALCTVRLNIRFNAHHTAERLGAFLHQACQHVTQTYDLDLSCSSDAFFTEGDHDFVGTVAEITSDITGIFPTFSTSGGTSDARFIKDYCPVVELGLINASIHKIDEHCKVSDLNTLSRIYGDVIRAMTNKNADRL